MPDLAKRNESGRRAERRTEVFLLNYFWVMKLSVDLDGAVFLVQPTTRSVESMRQQAGFPASVVKSLSCVEEAAVEVSGGRKWGHTIIAGSGTKNGHAAKSATQKAAASDFCG